MKYLTFGFLRKIFREKDFSYFIREKKFEEDWIEVVVEGVLRDFWGLRKRKAQEWIRLNLKDLAHAFCLEKYGTDCKENTVRFKREYLRARLFGTRYAVGVALKRIERNFLIAGEESFEGEAEAVELSLIYKKIQVEPSTKEQRKFIHKLLKDKGLSEEKYRKILWEKYGVVSSTELTKEEASEFIEFLKSLKGGDKNGNGKG